MSVEEMKEENVQSTEAEEKENPEVTIEEEVTEEPGEAEEQTEEAEDQPTEEKTEKKEEGFFKKLKKKSKEEELQARIEELENEVLATKNAYYKAYADAENFKKRLQSSADNANKYRIQSFAIEILPAIDSLERALAGKDVADPFVKGVKLTYDSIMNALTKEGVSVIDSVDKPFDANYHHAIMTEVVEGVEPGMVVEVLQKGYMLKDRLLRAALVKVSE